MTESDKIRRQLSDYFSRKDEIDTAILFGSFAKGTYSQHSDIDIALHSEHPLGFSALSEMQADLSLLCRREIDMADLSKAEGIFLHQIMTTGVRIKFSRAVFVKYLMKALCFREDFFPTIERSRREKIRRFIHG